MSRGCPPLCSFATCPHRGPFARWRAASCPSLLTEPARRERQWRHTRALCTLKHQAAACSAACSRRGSCPAASAPLLAAKGSATVWPGAHASQQASYLLKGRCPKTLLPLPLRLLQSSACCRSATLSQTGTSIMLLTTTSAGWMTTRCLCARGQGSTAIRMEQSRSCECVLLRPGQLCGSFPCPSLAAAAVSNSTASSPSCSLPRWEMPSPSSPVLLAHVCPGCRRFQCPSCAVKALGTLASNLSQIM